MVNSNTIIKDKQYWVLKDTRLSCKIGKKEYFAIKRYKFIRTRKKCIIELSFVFNESSCIFTSYNDFLEINESELQYKVFETVDDYLFYLVTCVKNNRALRFDTFMKKKIKESQTKHPEKWI